MSLNEKVVKNSWGRHLDSGTLLGDGLDVFAGFWKTLSRSFGLGKDKSQDVVYQNPPFDVLEQDVLLNVTTRSSAKRAAKLMLARLSPLPEAQIEWDIVGPHIIEEASFENNENEAKQSANKKSQYTLGVVHKSDLENWDALQPQHRSLKATGRNGGIYQFTSRLSGQAKRKQTLIGILAFVGCYIGLLWGTFQWVNRPVEIAEHWQEQARTMRLTTHDIRAELKQVKARTKLVADYQSNTRGVNMLDILASVAQTMSDGGWIREVNLSGNQIRFSGTTDNPAKLAAQMEAKLFTQRVQLGAVSADRSNGLQRFTLTITLADNSAEKIP